MKEIFNILNALEIEDVDWLLMNGRERRIKPDTLLIEEGTHPDSIYIVLQGLFGVKNSVVSKTDRLAVLGPGEILGELSFLAKRPASASVFAVEGSLLLELPTSMLEAQLEEDPRFAVRFYRALALGNAIRLRNTVKKLGTELNEVEEARQEPPSDWELMAAAIQHFKELLQQTDKAVQQHEGRLPDDYAVRLHKGLLDLSTQLEQTLGTGSTLPEQLKEELGRKAKIELLPYFLLTDLGERIYTKPRGYAGDFSTIERIYSEDPQGRGRIGKALDQALHHLPMIEAIRHRRTILQEALLEMVGRQTAGPFQLTKLAAGPADELFQLYSRLDDIRRVESNFLNIDLQAVAYIDQRIQQEGLSEVCRSINGNLVYLALGRQELDLPPQDLIYSLGLIDYFNDNFVVQLLDYIHQKLKPGGQLILGSFTPKNPQRALMDHVLDWELIHRDQKALNTLLKASKFGKTFSRFERVEGIYLLAFGEKQA